MVWLTWHVLCMHGVPVMAVECGPSKYAPLLLSKDV
jgi:hypothetical protein